MIGVGNRDSYVGNDAKSKRSIPTCKYPIGHDIVTKWCGVEGIWSHPFYIELCVAFHSLIQHHVLLTEDPRNSKISRKKSQHYLICMRVQQTADGRVDWLNSMHGVKVNASVECSW
uniref:Actin n=1 Tax=Echinococcus granulosus TaxID=6210 RepID=A0A068X2D9_ECHGR|nr:actin [Echinococcus granulosus]